MPLALEIFTQSEGTGNAPEQLAWLEIDSLWSRRGLTAGIALNPRNIVARVGLWVAVDRVVVQNTENFGHGSFPPQKRSAAPVYGVRPRTRCRALDWRLHRSPRAL